MHGPPTGDGGDRPTSDGRATRPTDGALRPLRRAPGATEGTPGGLDGDETPLGAGGC